MSSGPDDSPAVELSDLVVECVERIETDGPSALDAMCAEYPDHAAALREAVEGLLDFGLVGLDSTSPGVTAPTGADTALLLGASLDDYEIVRELGRGGMGVVYEARQQSLGRTVALKLLRDHLMASDDAVERFRREASILAGLRHRGIAQVYATGCGADGRHFLAMELLDGVALDRLIAALRERPVGALRTGAIRRALRQLCPTDGQPISGPATHAGSETGRGHLGEAAQLMAEVVDALACAHAAGIVHRDVKPANILLRREGSAVLTDFGLARRNDLPALTQTGAFAGTPFYTSPEQADGGRAVDHRADLFSLGVTLYELITLHQPFDAGSSAEVLHAIRHREPTDPRRYVRNLPRDLLAILQRALEKDPRRRYADAAAFAADLRAFASHRPVTAQPITSFGRVTRWAKRQPWQALLAACLILGTPLIAVLGYRVYRDREQVAAAERDADIKRGRDAVLEAYVAIGQHRFDEAEDLLELALRIDSEDVEAWAGQALAITGRDRAAAAAWLERFDRASERLRGSRALRRVAATMHDQVGDTERAATTLAELGPPRDPYESFWVGLRELQRGMRLRDMALKKSAYDLLRDAVLASPVARPTLHYWLAAAAGEAQDEDGARRAARAMQHLWPDAPGTWFGSGLALHFIDPEEAIRAYRRARLLAPDRPGIGNNLANVLNDIGRHDESIEILFAVVRSHPDYAVARSNLGRGLFYRGDLEGAVEQLRHAISLEPDDPGSQHYLVWSLQRLARDEEAATAAEAAIVHLPGSDLAWRDVARTRAARNDLEGARAAARRAVDVDPWRRASHDLLAELLLTADDPSEGLDHYRIGIACESAKQRRDRAREDFAGILLDRLKNPTPAHFHEALDIARELDAAARHRDPYLTNLLGRAHLKCGAPELAKAQFIATIELLDAPGARQHPDLRAHAERRLTELRGSAESAPNRTERDR